MVCGVSDKARHFHPVCFFILGRETEACFDWAVRELAEIYSQVMQKPLQIMYVMADACTASQNAILAYAAKIGVDDFAHVDEEGEWRPRGLALLMCLFHILYNVRKRLTGASLTTRGKAIRGVYDLHYARTPEELA